MSKYPVGPRIKSLSTFVQNVPTPPPLWLFYLLNGTALLVFSVLLIGLQFGNTAIVAQKSFEQALLVIHFFFIAWWNRLLFNFFLKFTTSSVNKRTTNHTNCCQLSCSGNPFIIISVVPGERSRVEELPGPGEVPLEQGLAVARGQGAHVGQL